jgi:prephenate dehydrogenase
MNIGIIGCGLIGGSIAQASKFAGHHVVIWDEDIDVRRQVVFSYQAAESPEALFAQWLDLIIIASPPHTISHWVKRALQENESVVVTDVASVKAVICEELSTLPQSLRTRWVAGHPLAGRSGSGLRNADPRLFKDAPWVLCPQAASNESIDIVESCIRACKATSLHITPEEHDRHLAYTSHLPQAVASIIMQTVGENHDSYRLSGGGLRDSTRIADLQGALWCDILSQNRLQILQALQSFRENLAHFQKLLVIEDYDNLASLLNRNAALRRKLQEIRWNDV